MSFTERAGPQFCRTGGRPRRRESGRVGHEVAVRPAPLGPVGSGRSQPISRRLAQHRRDCADEDDPFLLHKIRVLAQIVISPC